MPAGFRVEVLAGEPEIVQPIAYTIDDRGWLYGTQGIFTESNVGKPGAAKSERVPINGGVWRHHPTRKIFERWVEGVSNQWGLDWNDHGEAFFAACVVPHMWQAIEGGHYLRQAGSDLNPHFYELIQTIAWGRYEKAAYCGAMIYLGGAFPAEWRDKFFLHDIHMNKLRCEQFIREGSGEGRFLAARPAADFLRCTTPRNRATLGPAPRWRCSRKFSPARTRVCGSTRSAGCSPR